MGLNRINTNLRKKVKNKNFKINNRNYFMYNQFLQNLKKLHTKANNDQKSNILSIVAYDNMRKILRNFGFKFSDKQFRNAKNKRENNNINLKKYIKVNLNLKNR